MTTRKEPLSDTERLRIAADYGVRPELVPSSVTRSDMGETGREWTYAWVPTGRSTQPWQDQGGRLVPVERPSDKELAGIRQKDFRWRMRMKAAHARWAAE